MKEAVFDRVVKWATPVEAPNELRLSTGMRIVAIGDSITEAGGWLRAIEAVFARQYPDLAIPAIVNVGIGGQKAEDLAARFERDVVERQPDRVTISVGINDVWHRLGLPDDSSVLTRYRENLDRMVEMAVLAGADPWIVSPTVIEEDLRSEGNRRLVSYVAAGKVVAAQRGCGHVDLHSLFLDAIDRKADPGKPFTSDGVHMNPIGDVLMAIGVLRAWGVPDKAMAATDVSSCFPVA